MVRNKLVLYCTRLEQAVMWDVCKKRRCATSNCLFKKIINQHGDNLWSETPMRVSTLMDIKDNFELLTKPMPLIRTPVFASNHQTLRPVVETEVEEPIVKQAPSTSGKEMILPSDLLREEIMKKANSSN